jgi:hypothetical protein
MFFSIYMLVACKEIPAPPTCEDQFDTACFRGTFRTLLGSPVEDMEVCAPEIENIPCVLSDGDGAWKIPGLPKDSNVFLTATHPDFVSTVFPQHTSMYWYDWYKVAIPQAIMNSNANRLDVQLDSTRGHVLFLAWSGLNIDGIDTEKVADVIAEISVSDESLFYADALGLASSDLISTSSSGSGGILNVGEGELELTLYSEIGKCGQEIMFHYQGAIEHVIPVPIRAGFTTAIDVLCPN